MVGCDMPGDRFIERRKTKLFDQPIRRRRKRLRRMAFRDATYVQQQRSRPTFYIDLINVWVKRGRDLGVKLAPINQLVEHFSGEPSSLPCIWQSNRADEFVSI